MIKDMGRVAVIHRGEWEEGSSYDRLDVVSCGGGSYMCVSPTTERPPSDSWKIVALKGDAFTYGDFTEGQIANLMRPATDAAKRADDAIGRVDEERRQLERIREESADAVERSKTAATKANTAAGEAKSAATKADTAAGEATDAAGLAETAKINANTAAGEAKSAATKADTAARKADGAAETAGTAASTATEAAKKADTAAGKADSMAAKAEASAEKADAAAGKANEATVAATNAATKANEIEAKLTGNILKGRTKDTFIHVDDAFPSSLLGIEIEGATEQVTTTGKNLFDIYKLAEIASNYYAVENGNIKVIMSYNEAWSNVPAFITLDAGTYYLSGDETLEIRKASDNSTLILGVGSFTLDQATEIKIKVGAGRSAYPVVVKAQIEKGSTATAYEPYTGGKPSPSPDFPQEIKVVENPTIKILGKHLMSVGIDETGNSADNFYMNPQIDRLTFSFYVEKDWWTGNPNGPRIFVHEYYPSNGTYSAQAVGVLKYSKETGKRVKATISFKSALTEKYEGYICIRSYHGAVYTNCRDFMFSFGDANETYSEFKSAEQAITLPAEHLYLAKIGSVADEIKIDRDGNVSLIARIAKTLPSDNELSWEEGTKTDSAYASYKVNGIANKNGICCNRYIAGNWTNKSGFVYCPNGADIAIRDDRFTSKEKAVELLNGVVVYVETDEKTYDLGKINLPALPESVSNIWTDAEITPRTTIEYTKDVNIAIARIEDAIASIG